MTREELLIQKLLDEELDEAELAEVGRLASTSPEFASRLALYERLDEELGRLSEGEVPGDLPARISRAVASLPRRNTIALFFEQIAFSWVGRAAAASAMVFLAALAGWSVRGPLDSPATQPAGTPVAAPPAAAPPGAALAPALPLPGDQAVPWRFVLLAPGARSVAVVGDFNAWDPGAGHLDDPDGDGLWSGILDLTRGEHRYQFVIDGSRFVTDPTAPRFRPDGFGGRNSVVEL